MYKNLYKMLINNYINNGYDYFDDLSTNNKIELIFELIKNSKAKFSIDFPQELLISFLRGHEISIDDIIYKNLLIENFREKIEFDFKFNRNQMIDFHN